MFGEALLVAPVVKKDAKEWHVYLPAGEMWSDIGSTFQVCISHYDLNSEHNITCVSLPLFQYEESDGRFRIGFSDLMHGSQCVLYCKIISIVIICYAL